MGWRSAPTSLVGVWDRSRVVADCSGSKVCLRVQAEVTERIARVDTTMRTEWSGDGGLLVTVQAGEQVLSREIRPSPTRMQASIDAAVTDLNRQMSRKLAGIRTAEIRRALKEVGAQPPQWGCSCGIHAWHDHAKAMCYVGAVNDRKAILGAVLGWGRVVEHELAWRSQYAKPLALAADPERPWLIGVIAKAYGIPVVSTDYLASYALEYGERLQGACA
jgi:hypothetical protein